jgi:membrane associated rhomboid family serine protease
METALTSRFESFRNRGSMPVVSLILVACAAGLLVGSLRSETFAQLTVQGLALGSVYGILALALVLVYRATRVINFAQGELAMLTTYIAYQLMQWGSRTGRRSSRPWPSPSRSARFSSSR